MTRSSETAPQSDCGDSLLCCPAAALGIIQRLRRAGHEAYLVGGCVRDALMGIPPKDWDIATSASPDAVEVLFPRTVAVGKAFGVILVVTAGGEFEVATFRGDRDYTDGRRPSGVFFTSALEDVRRRDFTVNALLYDPLEKRLIDHVGGQADLSAGILRTVGDPRARFAEDHLRLLRAVRFAARTGFCIEAQTWTAMRELSHLVRGLAAERVGEELTRMLSEGYAGKAFRLLESSGLLREVLPEVAALRGVEQPPEFHPEGDVWVHTLVMLDELDALIAASLAVSPEAGYLSGNQLVIPRRVEREILAWAVLLHDIGKPATWMHTDRIRFHGHDTQGALLAEAVLLRLRRPGRLCHAVCELVQDHMRFIHIREMRVAKRRRFLQNDLFVLHLALHRIDCLGSHGDLSGYAYALEQWLAEQAQPADVRPLLSGTELLAAGYRAGPRMGAILRALADARLEGQVSTPDEALTWVREHFPLP